jgi:hypothetical protein
MKFLNTIVRWVFKSKMHSINAYMKDPVHIQQNWFNKLINKAKETKFGKLNHFSSLQNVKEFQKKVPLNDYESLKPFINRMMKGESDVLWPGVISWFSKSSGTTNDKSKFIPVSHENLMQCHIKGSQDSLILWYNSNPDTKLLSNGKGLIMGGSLQKFQDYPKTNIGDISAIMLKHMPFYGKYFHTPGIDIALMSEWEAKIEKIAQTVIKENLTNVGGVPTWTIVLFRRILELTGKKNILEVFPNFELYMHGGVSFTPYKNQFKTFLPSEKIQYREIYNASEGFFASQFSKEDLGMLLLLDNGCFFEFVPLSELNSEQPIALTLDEVDTNTNYAIVISTNSGLWRYIIGDTVKFTSLYPHKIQITGRTKHFINVFGEEVMVENSDKAIFEACLKTGALVAEYTVGPIFLDQGKGGHEWIIEFEKIPDNLEIFRDILDSTLQSINSDYEAKRYKGMALEKLIIKTVPRGSFHEWLKSKGKYGGQNKVPRLSNERKYIEEILQFVSVKH